MGIQARPAMPPAQWDALVESSDDTWLFHTHRWIELTSAVLGVENRYLIYEENGREIGGMPIQVLRSARYGRGFTALASIWMGSCGPFARRDLTARARSKVLKELTEAAVAHGRRLGAERLDCALPPLAPSNLGNARGVNPLVLAGWSDRSTHTRIADLSQTEAALMGHLAYDARRSVRLAGEAGYRVERGRWQDLFDDYYRVHVETYRRTGAQPHPVAYFRAVAALEEAEQAVLWVARDRSGRPVAFHNDGRFRDGSIYWTGCCETLHQRSGVNYLLFWHALRGAKLDGCRWYEIGEVFPDAATGKHRGLTLFKEKFGGELYRYYRGQIQLAPPAGPPPVWRVRAALHRLVTGLVPRRSSDRPGGSYSQPA